MHVFLTLYIRNTKAPMIALHPKKEDSRVLWVSKSPRRRRSLELAVFKPQTDKTMRCLGV